MAVRSATAADRSATAAAIASPRSIRVGLVDDHPAVVWGLEAALARTPDIAVTARAATAAGAADLVSRADLDVVLLDLRLPDGNGLDVLAHVGGAGSDAAGAHSATTQATGAGRPAVIVLATFVSRQHVAAARRLGARGYIVKTASTDLIAGAVRAVARGDTWFASEVAAGATPVELTQPERALIELVLSARSNDEIAGVLGVGTKSVEARLTRLYRRLGIGSRVELALVAEREGWLNASADPETGLPRYPDGR